MTNTLIIAFLLIASPISEQVTVAFEKTVIRIPAGTIVGSHHEGMLAVPQSHYRWGTNLSLGTEELSLRANEALGEQGYNVVGWRDPLFGEDQTRTARYILGGVITKMQNDTYGRLSGNYGKAYILVDWSIYDRKKGEVVYQTIISGRGRTPGDTSLQSTFLAFDDSFRKLIRNKKVQKALKKESKPEVVVSAAGVIDMRYCQRAALNLPGDMESIMEAVVTIEAPGSHGSGVVVSPDAYVVTAAHVVRKEKSVMVVFANGAKIPADVHYTNVGEDLAVLKLPGQGYPCLPIAAVRSKLGSDIFVVGTPRQKELSHSVSRGVVSGYRFLEGSDVLQTDAAVNPGNSGGPMLNGNGEVLGVVSWKYLDTQGIAFGVPVDKLPKQPVQTAK